MKKEQKQGHSEDSFTDDRNHWYNPDFLGLMAQRWGLSQYSSVLDVGSGMCHWSKLLVSYMQAGTSVTALDSDDKWSVGSADIAHYFEKKGHHIEFIQGNAHTLPFKDNSFDVVTCQTVLIHVKNPELALSEMKRVVKKGGIVICAEPNNRIQSLLQDTSNQDDSIDEVLLRVKHSLAFEKYKLSQNNGNNSFGDLLCSTMNGLRFKDIKAYMNDKLVSIYPPYEGVEQQAMINTYLKWGKTEPEKLAMDQAYQTALEEEGYVKFLKSCRPINADSKVVTSMKNLTYSSSGAVLLYLISGKK